jgi:hypothetical protein
VKAEPAPPSGRFRVAAYPPAWRFLAAALVLSSGLSLPAILAALVLASDPPITPPLLVRLFLVSSALPALGAALIRRAFAGDAEVSGDGLVLHRRRLRVEVPAAAIAAVTPWRLALPGIGLSLHLRSGRRFAYGLRADDPAALLRALAASAAAGAVRSAESHPLLRYAAARSAAASWRWYHVVFKFVLFPLLPAAVLFNAHQHIAFGGTFGQYYLEGPARYFTTFAVYWLTLSIYSILYAGTWRIAAEGGALAAAALAPARASAARSLAEWGCRLVYYGGVPLLLALRFSG